jgi:hypothetical protein
LPERVPFRGLKSQDFPRIDFKIFGALPALLLG